MSAWVAVALAVFGTALVIWFVVHVRAAINAGVREEERQQADRRG